MPPDPDPATDAAVPHPDTDKAMLVDDHGPAFEPPWRDAKSRRTLLAEADLTPIPDDPHDRVAHPYQEDGG